MKSLHVLGLGAVSPAGWGAAPLLSALHLRLTLPVTPVVPPGQTRALAIRKVPPPQPRPASLAHPRLRRSSPISQFAVAAATETLQPAQASGITPSRTGLIFCTMTGSVIYSRRFFDEALRDPATASPLLFPETVFNAPASHIAAVLGLDGRVQTEVGDAGCFVKGLTTAALWLHSNAVDQCLVVAAEESDWLASEGLSLLSRHAVASEGAGAVLLSRPDHPSPPIARLDGVTFSPAYSPRLSPATAADRLLVALIQCQPAPDLLVDATGAGGPFDAAERAARAKCSVPHLSPKEVLGEAWTASTAWQCIAAVNAVQLGTAQSAMVTVAGTHEQVASAHFSTPLPAPSSTP